MSAAAAGLAAAIAALAELRVIVREDGGRDRGVRRFGRTAATDNEHHRWQQPTDEPSYPKAATGAFHAVGFHGSPDSVPGGTHQDLIIDGQTHAVKKEDRIVASVAS